MKILDPSLVTSLQAARDQGIKPVYFVTVFARPLGGGVEVPVGLWSGDENLVLNVQTPEGGLTSRQYFGGCNLSLDGLQYVMDLTDNALTIGMSQIADIAQQLVRGFDVRLAPCEVHATTMTGGDITSNPQLIWIGIVDELQIATPAVGGNGNIGFQVRSEIMSQLTATNPAKSSNVHQKTSARE
ncbi:hypothetical protein [Paracoccus methylarcula]|uniref:hypothetical protein n=1 Tax=Paracoccus methylarcula TaxID=72022 RepID=UPI001FECC7EF|nr:hypothetical protein [Paracoccus methylarcula]